MPISHAPTPWDVTTVSPRTTRSSIRRPPPISLSTASRTDLPVEVSHPSQRRSSHPIPTPSGPLRHVGAAVHMQDLARHVTRVVRRQKYGDIGNVSGIRHPPQRDRARTRLYLFFTTPVAGLSRISQTRGDRIHADPVRS